MTLIATVSGHDSIWMVADRRLTLAGQPVKEDARKIMFLATSDNGEAILGYAGLGATRNGTEPADWMSAVLRGRNLPLEASLNVLLEATKKQLPQHLVLLSDGAPAHNVMIPAFVGEQVRFYTIDAAVSRDGSAPWFRFTQWMTSGRTPRFSLAGSGARYLARNRAWSRKALRLVRAFDRKKISAESVAAYLSELNHEVHLNTKDGSVGPRCIVAWRCRRGAHREGGGQTYFTGTTQDRSMPSLPTIANGMDISAIVNALKPIWVKHFVATRNGGEQKLNDDEIKAQLAKVPDEPDETLR